MKIKTITFIIIGVLLFMFIILNLNNKPQQIDEQTISRLNPPIFDEYIGLALEQLEQKVIDLEKNNKYGDLAYAARLSLNRSKNYLRNNEIISSLRTLKEVVYYTELMKFYNKFLSIGVTTEDLDFSQYEKQFKNKFEENVEKEKNLYGTSLNRLEWQFFYFFNRRLNEEDHDLAYEFFNRGDIEDYLQKVVSTLALLHLETASLEFAYHRIPTGEWFIEVDVLYESTQSKFQHNLESINEFFKGKKYPKSKWDKWLNITGDSYTIILESFNPYTNYFYSEKLIAEQNFFELLEYYGETDISILKSQLKNEIIKVNDRIKQKRQSPFSDFVFPDLLLDYGKVMLESRKTREELVLGLSYARRADKLIDEWQIMIDEILSKRHIKIIQDLNEVQISCQSIRSCTYYQSMRFVIDLEESNLTYSIGTGENIGKPIVKINGNDITDFSLDRVIVPLKKGTNILETWIPYKTKPIAKILYLNLPNPFDQFIYPFNSYELIFTTKLNTAKTLYKIEVPENYYLNKNSGLYIKISQYSFFEEQKDLKINEFYPETDNLIKNYELEEYMVVGDGKKIIVILDDAPKLHKNLFWAYILIFALIGIFYKGILRTLRSPVRKNETILNFVIVIFGGIGILYLFSLNIPFISIFYLIPLTTFLLVMLEHYRNSTTKKKNQLKT